MERKNRRYKKENVSKIKKTRIVIMFLAFIMLTVLFVLQKTGAIFQTITESEASLDIAFYCVEEDFQTMTLSLDEIVPRTTPYRYNFTISNNNGTRRTETELVYDLKIRTTTNLPITTVLYDTNSGATAIGTNVIDADDDGTFFNHITIPQREFGFVNNQTDHYRIQIIFPTTYKSNEYQDIIELVEINVDSKQKI